MRLFLVINEEWDCDETDEVVVLAENEEDALELALPEFCRSRDVELTAEEIDVERGVIYSSFHPG